MNDYYSILQLSPQATEAEIKKAYRKLSLLWHPDKNKSSESTATFIRINEAYSVLINPEKRTRYDALLKTRVSTPYRDISNTDPFRTEREEALRKSKLNYNEFSDYLNKELKKAAKSAPRVTCLIWIIIYILVMLGLALGLIKPYN